MTALAGDFLFGIPGNGLWVNDMILGHTYSANLDGYPIELTFPERDDDFGLDHPRAEYHAFGGQSASHEDSAARTVDIVRVVVRTEAPFGAAEFRQDDATRPSEAAFEVFRECAQSLSAR